MLTLCLKEGDYVKIGEDIRVYFVKSKSSNLYLGFEAPREKTILRGKLNDQLEKDGELILKNGHILRKTGDKVQEFAPLNDRN